MTIMREAELKAMVLSALRAEKVINRASAIASEYSIGGAGVRADLAVLSDTFVGVEIKSEVDGLRRLDRQLAAYRTVFDRVILVVAAAHRALIDRRAIASVEIWTVGSDGFLVEQGIRQEPVGGRLHLLTLEERKRWKSLVAMSPDEAFRAAFHARYGPTSDAFWKAVQRRRIRVEDLDILSRFKPSRVQAAEFRAARDEAWVQWQDPVAA